MIELTPRRSASTVRNIKIIGIGGAGANALDRLALDGVNPGHLIALNTDSQALTACVAGHKIQIGRSATRGLGSGGDPDLGRLSVEESVGEIRTVLDGVEILFILAGLGGGTGSGAAPVVAELAREAGALVITIVTLPFAFEGKRRIQQAAASLAALQTFADAVVCFENDRMADAVPPKAGIQLAFAAADQTLSQSVQAIAGFLIRDGLIHLGFDELQAALRALNSRCLFGFGEATGTNRPFDALARALKNPLMDKGRLLRDCSTVLVQVSGGPDLTLNEVQLLMEELNRHIDDRTRILFGTAVDKELEGRLTVTILSSIDAGETEAVQPLPPRATAAVQPLPPRATAAVQPVAPAEPPPTLYQEEPEAEPEPEAAEPVETAVEPEALIEEEAGLFAEIEVPAPEPELEEAEMPLLETAPVIEEAVEETPILMEPVETAAPVAESRPRRKNYVEAAQPLLFGEEPSRPRAERIQRPVPGRMLQRPVAPQPPAPPIEPKAEPPVEAVVASLIRKALADPAAEVLQKSVAAIAAAPTQKIAVEATPEPETGVVDEPTMEPAVASPVGPVLESAIRPSRPVSIPRPVAAPQSPLATPPAAKTSQISPAPAPVSVRKPGITAAKVQQETLQFESVSRGRFEKSEPTIVDGQDLDVPTFLRQNVRIR